MNGTQIQNVLAPIISALAAWFAAKGWLFDSATWNTLLGAAAAFGAAIWAAVSSRSTALASSLTSAVPGTTVVTTPAIAAATPASPNVVSNAEVKVVSK